MHIIIIHILYTYCRRENGAVNDWTRSYGRHLHLHFIRMTVGKYRGYPRFATIFRFNNQYMRSAEFSDTYSGDNFPSEKSILIRSINKYRPGTNATIWIWYISLAYIGDHRPRRYTITWFTRVERVTLMLFRLVVKPGWVRRNKHCSVCIVQ